ncbi:hypothetical protein [Mycobacterium phage WXIN]|nr:hypothetical protein [Mycobacterium phage WXIN]
MTTTQHKHNLRMWIMWAHTVDTPAGPKVFCGECGTELSADTMTIGHWPVPEYLGGTRTRNNVRPECEPCNSNEGTAMGRLPAKLVWEIVYERATRFTYLDKMKALGLQPIRVSPNFGKVHRRAIRTGKRWAELERNTPYRPRVWREHAPAARA